MVSHGVKYQEFSFGFSSKGFVNVSEHGLIPAGARWAVFGIFDNWNFHGIRAGAFAAGLIVDPADGDARAVDDGEDAFFGEDTVAVIVLAAHAAEHAGETHVG